MDYVKRYADKKIARYMNAAGCVVVSGPKFCGKTTTCMRFQKSFVKLNTDAVIEAARIDPSATLIGPKPRLIDEWQKVPEIWNIIKDSLDEDYQFGEFIITGSTTPPEKSKIHHGGSGRFFPYAMSTMSLFETGESKGTVSLEKLFKGDFALFDANASYSLSDTARLLCRGGWPIALMAKGEASLDIVKGYYKTIFDFEESDSSYFKNKDPELLYMILRSYARNISTEASKETIMGDVKKQGRSTLDANTFDSYIAILKSLFIIEDMDAWSPSIRSKTSIRTTRTIHFSDTSIAARALGVSPDDLLNDPRSFGLFFEDFAIHELRVYASSLEGEVRHYRDNTGLECDAIVHLENGTWGAIEIKLGGEELIADGINSLLRFRKKIEEKSDEKKPSFLMVLTAVGNAYKTRDGVYVVPINLLKD